MLRVESLTAGYGSLPIISQLDIHIGKNEAVAIVGANGAGKTTLVRTLCGLVRPMAGRIVKGGIDISLVPPHRRVAHGMGVVLEGRNLFTELTVRDNLKLAEAAGRKATHTKAPFSLDEIFQLFPMVQERYGAPVELLSGGQQQMVAISRALLLQPDLLILDELTTGLAPKVVKEILAVLNRLRARGMSIILVEQNIAIAAEMTDRAYVMSVGKIMHEVQRGEWPSLLQNETLVKAYLHG